MKTSAEMKTSAAVHASPAMKAKALASNSPEPDAPGTPGRDLIALESSVCARNYAPLPVVVERAEDVWIQDVAGRRYLDFMSAYSAVSHGHRHPRLVAAARAQLDRVCVTSRAFHSDTLGPFLAELCRLAGFERALPMNTGAEAVETAIKAARRWGYRVKGIEAGRAVILVADDNFHGRTTTIVGFSSEPAYRDGFGPFAPGFRHFRFGDLDSLDAAWDENVCAVLVEPIQGEAGIVVPPAGWLRALRERCDRHAALLILDEVQSGLGRTGRMFAYEHEGIRPDGLVLGKALGGGVLPVSAFLADNPVMGLFDPGSHGSTFGGNALAAAVGLEALRVLQDEQLPGRSAVLGRHLLERLQALACGKPLAVRGRGLWAGVESLDPSVQARDLVERLAQRGVLSKETHDRVIRIAPPLTITLADLDWGIDQLGAVLDECIPPRVAPPAESRPSKQPGTMPSTTLPSPLTRTPPMRAPAHLMLCSPEHYEVSYSINPWMEPDAWAMQAARLGTQARKSWRCLRDTYRALGARLEVLAPQPGLPDLVFTANSAAVLDGKAVLARFLNPERRGEEAHDRRFFENLMLRGLIESLHETPPGVCFEGAGDALWDARRKTLWLCYGQRSSWAARDTLRRVFGVDTVSLELASPRFYHLDTCLCVLPGGEMLWYPPAFTEASQALLRGLVGDALTEASEDDANHLGVNSLCLGADVVMGYCSPPLRDALEAWGYRIHLVPLEPFIRSGGAAYCLTLRLDNRSDGQEGSPGRLAA